MRTAIVACNMVKDELGKILEESNCAYPVHWIDTCETHAWPDQLKIQLQETLDALPPVDRVLLAFGTCGNALLGLQARHFQLIFPKVDDCISLVLGSCARRQAIAQEAQSYFMTRGWVDSPMNIWETYQKERVRLVTRWGEERGERLLKTTYVPDHYKRLVLIDTGAFNLTEVQPQTEIMAQGLGLRHEILPGTTDYLRRLVLGPWDEGFVCIAPNTAVCFEHVVGLSHQQQQ